jgi:hypothetical protein
MAAPVLYGGPVSFALGRLCALLGRSDEAAELLVAAQADCDELGARPFAARVRLERGRLTARRGERRAARELFEQCAVEAAELGMQGLAAEARAALEKGR